MLANRVFLDHKDEAHLAVGRRRKAGLLSNGDQRLGDGTVGVVGHAALVGHASRKLRA